MQFARRHNYGWWSRVVAGTDAANISRDYPVNVRVTAAESGLPRDTVFHASQSGLSIRRGW